MLIYKILLPAEWAAFQAAGQFDGSPFDHESGFVHFSSRDQVGATARRVFADEPAVVVAAVDAGKLGGSLRWEPARNGELFPHSYAPVPLGAVVSAYEIAGASLVDEALPRDEEGGGR